MNTDYKGMRWLKCDLQVQTPEDNTHWADDNLRLGNPRRPKVNGTPDESGIQEKARIFLRRCHELELDLIGLTDHNFSREKDPRDRFATHLIEQNKSVAKEFDRPPLTFLPGFEVDIGYHVLCLLAPAKKAADLEKCNTLLTKLGLPTDSRFDQSGPTQLRHNGQRVSLKSLLETVQDEHGGIVIAAHADQNSGIFNDASNKADYRNEDLYCVELTQHPPAEKYQNILAGNDISWCRNGRHPAYVMSSDAKSLQKDNGIPVANSLGYRHTWIKMSEPSIESLRQAFLDPDSRIRLPKDVTTDKSPSNHSSHPIVQSIRVNGTDFLDDQEVHFSPNMNCIIGGRGSGKSTLLEYLRIALGKDKTEDIDNDSKAKIERIRQTLSNANAELSVQWKSPEGVKDKIIWKDGRRTVADRDLPDSDTYFHNLPFQFYSQQQLNQLTESEDHEGGSRQAERLLALIDGFNVAALNELDTQETDVQRKLEDAFSQQRRISELKDDNKRLKQEHDELERQWKARSAIQNDAKRHQQLKSEQRYLDAIEKASNKHINEIFNEAQELVDSRSVFQDDTAPHSELLQQFGEHVQQVRQQFDTTIKAAVNQYRSSIESFKTQSSQWKTAQQELSQADSKFQEACQNLGLSEDDVGRLQEIANQKDKKQKQIDNNQASLSQLEERSKNTDDLLAELHVVWKTQYAKRQEAVEKANNLAKSGEHRFIETSAHYQQSLKSFQKLWETFSPNDKRTRLGKNWEESGQRLYDKFISQDGTSSPWQLLNSLLDDPESQLNEIFPSCSPELIKHIQDNAQKWEKLRTSRVNDNVDLILYRADGTKAGSISENSLSDGQRNTAALALLLAQEGGPLIIDQPEDELDSNFVFKELIPMLRKVKPKRQLIMATHNANLPVNGDAELVYALEAKEGKGKPCANGGLDQANVTKAVLDIMEGSEEAFRRRREKYHF